MNEESLKFTTIFVQKGRDAPKSYDPILAFDRKHIYVSSNYGLKFKDVSIEKSEHEKLVGRRGREKSVVLTLKTHKVNVTATLSNPNAQMKHKFDVFLENLEHSRGRVVGKKGIATKENVKSMGKTNTNVAKKRTALNAITPARGVYMSSPRKSPGRLARSLTPMKRHLGSRIDPFDDGKHHVETKGNVVSAPKERREMKLNPKSPMRATPSRREVEPKMEVKRSVFSQEEYQEQSDEHELLDDDMSEDNLLGDSPEVPKRKRLMKLKQSIGDDDSDVEFEEPKAKKKLRLEEEEAPSPEDRDVWMGMNSGIERKDTDSRSDEHVDKNDGEKETEIRNAKNTDGKENTAVDEYKSKPTKTIQSFFTAKPSANPKTKSDTFGSAILSSPLKSTKTSVSTPPPSVPERAPALKQIQRTGINSSSYFASAKKEKNDDNFDDDMLYQDDGKYYEGEISEGKEEKPQKRQFFKSYGIKQPKNPYSRLGTSRLAARRQTGSGLRLPPSLSRNSNGEISPGKRLEFGLPSTADRALGSGRKPSLQQRKFSPPKLSFDAVKDIDEADKPTIAGIQNLGNTCYLSASLQNLFSIPNFLRDLYKAYEVECTKKDMPLTKALLEVAVVIAVIPADQMPMIDASMAASKLSSNKAANPSALKRQMDVLTDKFVGYEQRDAHEFLSDLVDCLHEELVAEEKKDRAEAKDVKDKSVEEDVSSSDKENDDSVSAEVNSTPEKKKDIDDPAEAKKDAAPTSEVPPTDDYFHLKVRVCLECDSCKYSR